MSSARARLYRGLTRLPDRLRPPLPPRPLTIAGGIPVGMRITGVGPRHIQAYGLVRGSLEPMVQEALRRTVAPGALVYDVGANLGFFTLVAAALGARVVAFEPEPSNAAHLRATVALNRLDAEVREAAAAERSGRAELLAVDEASWSHLADRGHHPRTRRSVEVETVALDDLPPADVYKIDVEGSEVAVLRGMARTLREHAPVLIVETHATNAEVCDLLEPLGYAVENLDGPQAPRTAGPVHLLSAKNSVSRRPSSVTGSSP